MSVSARVVEAACSRCCFWQQMLPDNQEEIDQLIQMVRYNTSCSSRMNAVIFYSVVPVDSMIQSAGSFRLCALASSSAKKGKKQDRVSKSNPVGLNARDQAKS